jgi:hypothetical protein
MRTSSRTKANTKRGFVLGKLGEDQSKLVGSGENRADLAGYVVRAQLQELLENQELPASARVTAARTLAEMDGFVGRHQSAPEKGTTAPLSSLSRDQLQDELTRLRTLFDLGLVS